MKKLEIVCPAGTPSALKTAVDAGADTVYCGFRNETNARNFPGLNFSKEELFEGIAYAKSKGSKVLVAINTYPTAGKQDIWHQSIADAEECGAYAAILADIGLLDYAHKNHPNLKRHLSVQATASSVEAINYFINTYDVARVVLPRVLTLRQIKQFKERSNAEIEVFVYGGLCVMAEGKCSLSSYITGKSPNKNGVCSPAEFVEYEDKGRHLVSKLNNSVINSFRKEESPGYPTICKGRFNVDEETSYLFEEPTSLSIIDKLPELLEAGVSALKIEGRQRGKAYVESIVKQFRAAVDAVNAGQPYDIPNVEKLSEGNTNTTGAYVRKWL
ncbi:MAG: U32 family peptidase [Alphaproteobacteria bacterium]|jgi:putative protease|nr:U32 family peptidase [Alphaproteobacteria bacterium]